MSDFKEILDKAIAAEMQAQATWVGTMVRGIMERTGIPITDLELVRSRDALTVQIKYVPTNTVLATRILVFKDAPKTF
jgi:hypothetical protein